MITILCNGSRGDIQPYMALAIELKKLGKDVSIVSNKAFKDFVKSYHISFIPLSADLETANIDPKLLESAGNSTNPIKMLLTFNKMKKYARLMVDEMYEACQGSELIVYHPGCTIGYFAGEALKIPSILASPFPMQETKEYASVIAYGKSKMPISMSYKMLHSMLWMASKTGVASFWKETFGTIPPNFGCPFSRIDENHPSIVSCSNYVFPRPKDWNTNVHQYGYWFLDHPHDYRPSKELMEFLNTGKKPIYFGFGSVFDQKEGKIFIDIITRALQETGNRGILCGMGKSNHISENIFMTDNLPHTWLFDKCSAVCHHGGAGTSAAGFSAGIPSIIVPFSNDQFAWAHRSFDLLVGARPIYKKDLSETTLAEAIRFISSPQIIERAKQLGEHIASEQGALQCAKIITNMLDEA